MACLAFLWYNVEKIEQGVYVMKEVAGGLWFAGLLAWALLGIIPGIILLLLGTGAASWGWAVSCKLQKLLQAGEKIILRMGIEYPYLI